MLKDDDTLIGSCGFFHLGSDFQVAETGYELKRSCWGQGIMAEAAVVEYGFNELGFHRIKANIDIANGRSKGLLLKLSFIYEENLRQRYFFRGASRMSTTLASSRRSRTRGKTIGKGSYMFA